MINDKKPIEYKEHEINRKWHEENKHRIIASLTREEIDEVRKKYTHWQDIEDACMILLADKMKKAGF